MTTITIVKAQDGDCSPVLQFLDPYKQGNGPLGMTPYWVTRTKHHGWVRSSLLERHPNIEPDPIPHRSYASLVSH